MDTCVNTHTAALRVMNTLNRRLSCMLVRVAPARLVRPSAWTRMIQVQSQLVALQLQRCRACFQLSNKNRTRFKKSLKQSS